MFNLFRPRLRRYRYRVNQGGMRFNVIVNAYSRDHAADEASAIGMKLGLMLIGPL